MGSLIMHLCIAEKLKEKYKFSDKFIIGEIMPDLLKMAGKSKETTHYLEKVFECDGVKTLPNILKYECENEENLKDEKVLGYVSHLVQDKIWFDKYIGKYAKTDANNIDRIHYLEYNIIKNSNEFSQDIQNDYNNVDKYLVDKYKIDVKSIRNTLEKISPDKEFLNKIDKSLLVDNYNNLTQQNVFITKEDVDTYINESLKKSSIEINKILGK